MSSSLYPFIYLRKSIGNFMALELKIKDNKIYAPLKDNWLVLTPEEKVRQNYICTLVNNFGYDLKQMKQELKVTSSKRGTGAARADIVIWKNIENKEKNTSPIIVIECKAENVKIQKEDYFQGQNYAAFTHAKFFVITNEKETKYFKVIDNQIPDELDEIVNIPQAKDLDNEKKITELLAQTKKFTRDEFQNLLFSCHNVIRNNDKLSPEMAFDEISKILFMKIRFERSDEKVLFSKEEFEKLKKNDSKTRTEREILDKPFFQYFFDRTKSFFEKDEIFEPNDNLKIREASFLSIVKLLEKYNLSDTSDDVKGIAFEEFLGKTFRGDLGQFFTPRTIVDFMVQILNPVENELICDPCCGTGGFLIKSFEHIRENIENEIQKKKEYIRKKLIPNDFNDLLEEEQNLILNNINNAFEKLNYDLNPQNKKSRLYNLSYRCIFGTDAEPRSARTAKMNMIMHGDGHGGVHHHDGLINVNGIFDNRFDVIITNPPFGARVSKELTIAASDVQIDPDKFKDYREQFGDDYVESFEKFKNHINKSLLDIYDTGKMTTLTEVLFVERCLNLLKPGGRMGIVLPEGFLNNSDLQKIRDFVEGKAKIILIVSIPQDVFIAAGATVKPSLVFLKKFSDEEKNEYQTIVKQVTIEINQKYAANINDLNELQQNGWYTEPKLWYKIKPLARQNRKEQTNAEKLLWNELRNNKLESYKIRRQHSIDRFIVDFYNHDTKLIIEIDGDIHQYTKEEDQLRQEFLEGLGFKVIRFRNEEVFGDINKVLSSIREALKNLTPNPSPQAERGTVAPFSEERELKTPLPENRGGAGGGVKERLKELKSQIESEIKAEIKNRFDYQIPIAQVEKAGISSTGSVIENELLDVLAEFQEYKKENPVWQTPNKKVEYDVLEDNITRISFHDFCGQYNVESF
ncbi:MAG: methylase [Ignavibacteria bacterium]|nr:methylase [Ignavibacteria bacterium]